MKLSIVSPVYKAENLVDLLVTRIVAAVETVTSDYEIILVEDGSPDKSWQKIEENCAKNSKIVGIKLSRNFGQHYAITAGIAASSGDSVILMDCDLQDDPKNIIDLVAEKEKGFDIVFTKRKKRKHSQLKKFNSWIYNLLFDIFSERKYDIDSGSFVIFSRSVANVFLQLKDKDRLYLQMLKWVGFKNSTITVEHQARPEGKSSYNFLKLLKLGLQGWTSHSDKLLRLSIYFGFLLSVFSFLIGISVLIRYLIYDLQPGWPSIIISILFSTGLILLSIGIAGLYVGKIFDQVKDRPLYIVEKEIRKQQ